MTKKEAAARLAAFKRHEPLTCDGCGETAGAVVELGDARQGAAFCAEHFRRFLDGRYAEMGMPVTAAERDRRAASGVRI